MLIPINSKKKEVDIIVRPKKKTTVFGLFIKSIPLFTQRVNPIMNRKADTIRTKFLRILVITVVLILLRKFLNINFNLKQI